MSKYDPEYYEKAAEYASETKSPWAAVWRDACIAQAEQLRSSSKPIDPRVLAAFRAVAIWAGPNLHLSLEKALSGDAQ